MLVAERPEAFSPRIAAKASLKSPVEIPLRYSAGINASRLSCPAHKRGKNRTGEPPSVTMPHPRLTNFNRTNSSDYLPLWQMPIAYHQPLSILITSILVELDERRLPRFRSRPATTCVLLPAAIVPKTASLHLLLAPRARSLYSLALVHPFFLASSGEAAVGFFSH